MDRCDRHPRRATDVHDLELAGSNQLVRRRPANPEHRRGLDDRQQQPLALLDLLRGASALAGILRSVRSTTADGGEASLLA